MSRHPIQVASAVLLLFLAGLNSRALACTCAPLGPPCQAYWSADVVFIGVPLTASTVQRNPPLHQRVFRFRVKEAFRGVEGTEVEVATGLGDSDCGFNFQTGTEYLVYGHRDTRSGLVGASICSRTGPLSTATEDLSYIRGIAALAPGGSIYGSATLYKVDVVSGGDRSPAGPVAGAIIVASSGERSYEAVTGSDGRFSLTGLPPGKYTVRAKMPGKLTPVEEETVELSDRGCAEIKYHVVVDGRITGRLLDDHGLPLGIKRIDLKLADDPAKSARQLWARTEADGGFQFTGLAPGRYILGINVGDAPAKDLPYETTYYPSTPDESKAEVLVIGEGEQRAGISFRLPPALNARMVQGFVVWPDGRPAFKAEVSLTDVKSDRLAGWYTKTDRNGQFQLSAFDGVQYKIRATIPADPNWNPDSGKAVALLVTRELLIMPSQLLQPVRLVIEEDNRGTKRTTRTVRSRNEL
jgi:hypothetical protein